MQTLMAKMRETHGFTFHETHVVGPHTIVVFNLKGIVGKGDRRLDAAGEAMWKRGGAIGDFMHRNGLGRGDIDVKTEFPSPDGGTLSVKVPTRKLKSD